MFTKDTVRLCVQFKSFTGEFVAPKTIKLTIYNEKEIVIEEITEDIKATSNATGNYYYDYIAPDHNFIFEFSGVYNGKPVLVRRLVETSFI